MIRNDTIRQGACQLPERGVLQETENGKTPKMPKLQALKSPNMPVWLFQNLQFKSGCKAAAALWHVGAFHSELPEMPEVHHLLPPKLFRQLQLF